MLKAFQVSDFLPGANISQITATVISSILFYFFFSAHVVPFFPPWPSWQSFPTSKTLTVTWWVAFVSVGVGASQRIPLSVLAWNPHKGLVHNISHETRRGWGREGPRDKVTEQSSEEKESVKRRKQDREVDWTNQPREQTSRQKSGEADGQERPVTMLYWSMRENESAFLVLCGSFARAHARISSQNARKVSLTSAFLCLRLTQACDCLYFISSTLSVVYW